MKKRQKYQENCDMMQAHIPEILAMRRVGATQAEIAVFLGVTPRQLAAYCKSTPALAEIACTREYREEYVIARLFEDFKSNKLSEKGKLKLAEILLKSGLLDLKKKLVEIETKIKAAAITDDENKESLFDISLSGLSSETIDNVMRGMTCRARGDTDRHASDYIDGGPSVRTGHMY